LIGAKTRDDDIRQVLAHIGTVDTATLRAMLLSLQSHSAQDVLPNVRVPLLIFSGDRDPFALSDRVGVPMHESAPGSELIRLLHGTHTALLDEPEEIAREVEKLAIRTVR
jgi:pimeloyl-ACP methyl ester carboxylesterase